MVKLQRHKAYTYKSDSGKEIEHHKHLVVLPEKVITEVGWAEGMELSVSIAKNTVVLSPKDESELDDA